MAPGDVLNFERSQKPPVNPLDRTIGEAAILLAERKILGPEPSKESILLAKNNSENQEMINESKRDLERQKRKVQIEVEAKKMEPGLKHLVVLMDRRDKEHNRKETGFINMILAAGNPADALVRAFEVERKERLDNLDKKEQAA